MTAEQPQTDDPSPAAAPDDVESLRARLAEEQEKAQSFYASWQRAAADYQNFKRRV